MLALRTSTSLSALGLMLGIAGTSWLTALTYERAPATRPFAEVVMPVAKPRAQPETVAPVSRPAPLPTRVAATPRRVPEALVPVYTPSPRYPMSALRTNREGQVILSVTVTPEGSVAEVSVGRSSGDMDLDHAAEEAVRNWRFASAENRAPRYTADLPVRFELTRAN